MKVFNLILGIFIISILSILSSSAFAYECTEDSVRDYLLNYKDSITSADVIQSKVYEKYGKKIFSADVTIPAGKSDDITFFENVTVYVVCDTGKLYLNHEPPLSDLTGIKKLSRELYEVMQKTNNDIDIIVSPKKGISDIKQYETELQKKGMDIYDTSELSSGCLGEEYQSELDREDKLCEEKYPEDKYVSDVTPYKTCRENAIKELLAKYKNNPDCVQYMIVGKASPSEINEITNLEWVTMVDYNGAMFSLLSSDSADYQSLKKPAMVIITILLVALAYRALKKKKLESSNTQ